MSKNMFHIWPVALYPPNLVGYLRLVLLAFAAFVRETSPRLCAYLFLVNFLLDCVDGVLARTLKLVSHPAHNVF